MRVKLSPLNPWAQVAMLSSVLDVIDLEGRNHGDEIRVGGFDLIHAGGLPNSAPLHRTGEREGGSNLYTTALGTEIPQQRVDRMPRGPETNLPPSGAERVGTVNDASRRYSCPSLSVVSGPSTSAEGSAGAGGASGSPARTGGRGGGSGGASGGGSGSGSAGSSSARSSSSLTRGVRTGSSENLSKEGRGTEGRIGRGETGGGRGAKSCEHRSSSSSSANGSGNNQGCATGGKAPKSGDRDHRERDRERSGKCRHREKGGGDDKRPGKSPLRPVEDSGTARPLLPSSRGSSSAESERLLSAPVYKGV